MEFVVKKDALEARLQLMQGVVETKITMPILANIWMMAEEGQLHLKATDLEIGLDSVVECQVRTAGTTTLNVKKLYEIVKSMPEGDMHFARTSDSGVVLTSKTTRFELVELPAVEFPRLPDLPKENRIALPGKMLADLLDKIFFNLAGEEQQQHKGALFILTPDAMTLVATDGHRLTYAKRGGESIQFPGRVPEYRLLLNRKAIHTILRLGPAETIEFVLGENHMFFRVGSSVLSVRLPELKFPNYEKVIPKDHDRSLKISVAQLLQSLKRVCLITSDRARPTCFGLTKNGVHLSSISAETGKAEDFVPAEYSGDKMEIRFNAQYLIDFLQVVGTEAVEMELKDSDKAAVLKPVGDGTYEYYYVLMPMRV